MSAHAGTAYVDVRGDFDALTHGVRAQMAKIGAQTAKVKVDVDYDKSAFRTLAHAFEQLPKLAGAAIGGITALGSGLTSLGPLVTGLAITVAVALAPAIFLLGSSMAAAALGAGALGVALVGIGGPALLFTVALFSRFATILEAVKERAQGTTSNTRALAAATEAITAAQANLRTQTTAAWDAWADSVERVKDGILAVEQAELGIDQARLNTRKAKQALKEFTEQAEVSAGALDSVFKRFTDVDVDFDTGALRKALESTGVELDTGDNLDFEQLILNVRAAKLAEKQATDTLGDSKRQLNRDRRTEARFLRDGIAAYEPYTAAVRQAASAQRAAAAASERQVTAWSKLNGTERAVVRAVERIKGAFENAFGPGVRAAFRGVIRLIDTLSEQLSDKKVTDGFTAIGRAVGYVFRVIAREISRKDFRDSFTELTNGAARLIRSFGGSAVRTTLRLLTLIATEALPPLERGLRRVSRWFDRLLDKSTEKLPMRDAVDSLVKIKPTSRMEVWIANVIDQFRTWVGITREAKGIIVGLLKAAGGEGQTLAENLKTVLNRWNRWINDEDGQRKLREFFRWLRTTVEGVAKAMEAAVNFAKDLIPEGGADGRNKTGGSKAAIDVLKKTHPLVKILSDILPGRALGGLVNAPRSASDNVLQPLSGGEYVIRRSVVDDIGPAFFDQINMRGAAALTGAAGRSGPMVREMNVTVVSPPGTAPDGRYLAAQLEQEFGRLGRG